MHTLLEVGRIDARRRARSERGFSLLLWLTFDSETIFVPVVNFFTGIFAGFSVFSFLGYLAWELNTSVDLVVDNGRPTVLFHCALRLSRGT